MTEAVSAAKAYLAVNLDGVWERFHEVKSTPEIGESADKIDVTNLDSEIKEYIKDIPDMASDLEFVMNAMPTGAPNSNYDLIKRMSKNATYEFKYGIPQMGIYFIIKAQWSWKMGAGEVSSPMEITMTLIPKGAPNDTPITAQFKVIYDKNEGTGEMTDPSSPYENGAEVKVLENTFTPPEGKRFLAFNTSVDNTGRTYDPGDTFNIYNDVTLYAIWGDDDAM